MPVDVPPVEEAPLPGPDEDEPVPEVVVPDDARPEGAPLLEAAPVDDGWLAEAGVPAAWPERVDPGGSRADTGPSATPFPLVGREGMATTAMATIAAATRPTASVCTATITGRSDCPALAG
jgi:hypothetical protein